MAIAVDVTNLGEAAADSASTTVAFTTGSAVASNGFIVVTVCWIGSGITLSSVSGGGLTWAIDAQGKGGVNDGVAVVSAQAPAGLASSTTITATFSGTGATAGRMICGTSFTGVLSASALDVAGTVQTQSSTTAWTSGNLTVAAGSMTAAVGYGVTSDFTSTVTGPSVEDHDFGAGAGTVRQTTCHRVDAGGGSVSVAGTWATAQTGCTIGAAYKAAPVSAAAPVSDAVLYSVVSGPGGFFGPLAFIEERVITAIGPLTIPQTLTGDVVAVTASMVRQVNKLVTATSVAATGTMQRLVGKLMTATTSAVSASMVREVNKLLTAASVAVSASIATVKVKLQTMTATTVVVTASMLKQVNKLLTASSAVVTASIVKQVNKALSATAVAVTATLSTVKVKLLAMTATTVAVTASMLKQVNKPLTATTIALSATMQRQVNKILAATTVVVTASLATLKAKFLTMTATTVSVSVTMVRQVQTHLTAPSVALSASLTKQANKRLTATTSAVTASMTTVKVKLLAMTATTVAVSASMVRRIGKTLSATSVVTGFLQAVSSAITAFFSKQFDPTVGRGHSRSNPQDSEYESDAEGNIRSDPQQRGFD